MVDEVAGLNGDGSPQGGIGAESAIRRVARFLTLPAVMCLIVVVMVRPTLGDFRTTLPHNLGDPALNTWILAWQSHALVNEPSQWFDGNIFALHGSAIGYSEVMLPLVPLFALVVAFTDNAVLAHNVCFIALLVFSMWATFALARFIRIPAVPALVAATAFTFSSYTFAHLGHLQLLTVGFFSLGLLTLLRLVEHRRLRDGAVAGAASALLVTACLYYSTVWIVIVFALLLTSLLIARGRPGRQWWLSVGMAGLVGGLLVAPVGIVYLRFQRTVSFSRPLIPEWGADLGDFFAPAPGSYMYRRLADAAAARPAGHEHTFFLGTTMTLLAVGAALFLVATALLRRQVMRRREPWLLLAVAAAVSFLLSFGASASGGVTPFRLAYDYVPGFDSIRVPARLIVPFLLVAALAASRLLALIVERLNWSVVASIGALGVVMLELAAPVPRVDALPGPAERAMYEALRRMPVGMVVELPAAGGQEGVPGVFAEAPRMLFSIGDWRDRVNGTSGGSPPGFDEEIGMVNRFPSPATVQFLNEKGVRYVVLRSSGEPGPFVVTKEFEEQTRAELADEVVYRGDGYTIFDLSAG